MSLSWIRICLVVVCSTGLSLANPVSPTAAGYVSGDSGQSNYDVPNPTNTKLSSMFYTGDDGCEIATVANLHDYVNLAEKEENVVLFEFNIKLQNYTFDPFVNVTGLFFKPWLWYMTRSRHGRTLLMLSFHYDVLSMNILTIGVKKIDVEIVDTPRGCFGAQRTDRKVIYIREMILSRNTVGQSSSYGKSAREEFACNQEIQNDNGDGSFVYNCCFKDTAGKIVCSTETDDFWISILYFSITLIKILMFLFCPAFIPANVYSATYAASEYMISLKNAIKMKIFVSEKMDANVRFKKRVTLEDISEWWRFRKILDTLPCDEIIPIKINELKIKVKGKRIIPENDPPTGLLKTIFDNMVRCKVKNLDPFKECCETSIYASMEPNFKHKISWHKFVQTVVKIMLLLLIPLPYYIRLIIYFQFEEDEVQLRRAALKRTGLSEAFNFYKTNVMQYFTPGHGVFIATYSLYFLSGLILGFTDENFRSKLKGVAKSALSDMSAVSQTGVLGIIIRTLFFPFKRCGLLGFLIAPFYFVLTIPLCACVFVLYCIPTIYLSLRLPYHARKILGTSATMAAAEKRLKLAKLKKLGIRISKMDKFAHHSGGGHKEDSCFPEYLGFQGCISVKNVAIQIGCAIFCLCILYSVALVFSESIGLFVEVMAFTMMGIIVNAGSVLKYVSMVLLVFVYMNDCYSNVYENYLTFNKTIIDDIIERTTADLRKIASMPSSQQANTAFQVKCVDEEIISVPTLNFDKKEIRWRVGQLLLFLDCFDTPRIPLRLFQKLCQVRVYGAPGPVFINLIAATGKFMIIVIFLAFVMIVVMAFGNVYAMSSTNTTLATLAGGFVPMLLKNVLSSKGARLSLKTVSFKGQIDEIIGEYKQYWPIIDFLVERDIPEEEEEVSGEGGQDEKKGETEGNSEEKKGSGTTEATRKDSNANTSKETDQNKKENETKGDANKKSSTTNKPKEGQEKQENPEDNKPEDSKKNGDIVTGEHAPPKHEEDEGLVDLFIDLSVADTAGWSIYESSESLPSEGFMPGYFDPNKIIEADENYPTTQWNYTVDPPAYIPVTYHKEPPV